MVWAALAGAMAVGCDKGGKANPGTASGPTPGNQTPSSAQATGPEPTGTQGETAAVILSPSGSPEVRVRVEVAATNEERRRGLMYIGMERTKSVQAPAE